MPIQDEFGSKLLAFSTNTQVISFDGTTRRFVSTISPPPIIPTIIPVAAPYIAPYEPPKLGFLSLTPSLNENIPLQTTNIQSGGNILPTKLYQDDATPYFIPYSLLSSLQAGDPAAISSIVSTIITPVLNTSTIYCQELVGQLISLDNAFLTANNTELLLNGVPIATTSMLSNVEDWALYPAISNIDMSNYDIINIKTANSINFNSSNLAVNQANISSAYISDLTVYQQTTINFASTIDVFIRDLTASTINLQNDLIGNTANAVFSNVSSLSMQTGNLTATTINGTPFTPGSNWSQYAATSAVNMSGYALSNTSNIVANNNININTRYGGLVNDTVSVNSGSINLNADGGLNVSAVPDLNITSQNGLGGKVNILADTGNGGTSFGTIAMTANGGTTGGVGTGGLITLTANTPLGTLSNATSAIKLSAAGINSYAGAVPSIGSLAGYNFIYGTGGVNICAGIPSILPNFPGTTFIYGTSGVEIPSNIYALDIQPYWDGVSSSNGDVNIHGRTVNLTNKCYVSLSNVKHIYMDFFADIQNAKLINMSNTGSNAISNLNNLNFTGTGAITGVNTINGAAYPPPATGITAQQLTSTTQGLGSIGYISSLQLTSTVRGLGSIGYISTPQLVSTVAGLPQSGYLQAPNLSNVSSISGSKIRFQNLSSIRGGETTGSAGYFNQFMRYDYNPPTAVGGAEIAISGKAQNAGAITTLSMGTDVERGVGYVGSFWDSYISMPLEFYGATIEFQSDADTILFMDGRAGNPATLSTGFTFYQASTITQKNQNLIANTRQPFIQYGKITSVAGSSGSSNVILPIPYANTNYVAQITMEDTTPAQLSLNITAGNTFTLYWANAGGGTHTIAWTTFGDL